MNIFASWKKLVRGFRPPLSVSFYVRLTSMDETLIGGIEKRGIVVVDYDQRWPGKFQRHAQIIGRALGKNALAIEHVGSTSVPELAAKPIVDILVIVQDSGL